MKKLMPFIFFLLFPFSFACASYNIFISDDEKLDGQKYFLEFFIGYNDKSQDFKATISYDSEFYKTKPLLQLPKIPECIFVILSSRDPNQKSKYECCVSNKLINQDWLILTYHVFADGEKTRFAKQGETLKSAVKPMHLFLKILSPEATLPAILSISHGNLIRFE